ncbi:unnamed protein product, partial [Amoebophrya sp. A25]
GFLSEIREGQRRSRINNPKNYTVGSGGINNPKNYNPSCKGEKDPSEAGRSGENGNDSRDDSGRGGNLAGNNNIRVLNLCAIFGPMRIGGDQWFEGETKDTYPR